jgi:hypothetical protein
MTMIHAERLEKHMMDEFARALEHERHVKTCYSWHLGFPLMTTGRVLVASGCKHLFGVRTIHQQKTKQGASNHGTWMV